MARLARVVAAGVPHHVTQRGNRRQSVFFSDDDYRAYADLLAEGCAGFGVAVWGYCLMPDHVHLILVPGDEAGLRAALAMDEAHLLACARYVELNPVRATLAAEAQAWPWSSARVHLAGRDDDLVQVAPMLNLVGDWAAFLAEGLGADVHAAIRSGERTGRPLGDGAFVAALERDLGRTLARRKPGRKPKAGESRANVSI